MKWHHDDPHLRGRISENEILQNSQFGKFHSHLVVTALGKNADPIENCRKMSTQSEKKSLRHRALFTADEYLKKFFYPGFDFFPEGGRNSI